MLGMTKGTFLSFQMDLNSFQGRIRSGVAKGKPWLLSLHLFPVLSRAPCQTIILNIPVEPP